MITYGLNLTCSNSTPEFEEKEAVRDSVEAEGRRILLLTMPVLVLIQITCQELSCHDTILHPRFAC